MMNKIKMAVIGVNGFGQRHAAAIADNENTELIMVCDINEEGVKAVGEKFKVPYCTDYHEVLNNPEIEAVTIALPDQLHVQVSMEALEAGKHVLCEKPLALELSECKEMIKAAQASDKKFMVGQLCRYTPAFIKAKEYVDKGEIGQLFFVESEYAHDYADIDTPWRLDVKRHPMIGGGCHAIDLLRWVAGNPEEVVAYANHFMLQDRPADDCMVAIMKYPSGVIGKVFCSAGCKRRYTMRTVLYGSEGTIVVDNKSDTMSIFKYEISSQTSFLGDRTQNLEIKIPVEINNHNVGFELADFVRIIQNDLPVEIDAREGSRTVAVAEAMVRSASENQIIKVDYNF